jgi:hypothetical protein
MTSRDTETSGEIGYGGQENDNLWLSRRHLILNAPKSNRRAVYGALMPYHRIPDPRKRHGPFCFSFVLFLPCNYKALLIDVGMKREQKLDAE